MVKLRARIPGRSHRSLVACRVGLESMRKVLLEIPKCPPSFEPLTGSKFGYAMLYICIYTIIYIIIYILVHMYNYVYIYTYAYIYISTYAYKFKYMHHLHPGCIHSIPRPKAWLRGFWSTPLAPWAKPGTSRANDGFAVENWCLGVLGMHLLRPKNAVECSGLFKYISTSFQIHINIDWLWTCFLFICFSCKFRWVSRIWRS